MKELNKQDISNLVENYPTKNKAGFLRTELEDVLKKFPHINRNMFNNAMMGNTCQVDENGKVINYHCDVYQALICGLEDRELTVEEWD